MLCNEVKIVSLGDRVSAFGGCQAAVTARARCGQGKFWNEAIHWIKNFL